MKEIAISLLEGVGFKYSEQYHSRRIKKIMAFLQQYPNARLITTSQTRSPAAAWQYHDYALIGSWADGSTTKLIWAIITYGALTDLNIELYNSNILTPNPPELFRRNLLRRKELKGLSTAKLAELAQMKESEFKRAESTHNVNLGAAARIARALNLNLADMLNKLI